MAIYSGDLPYNFVVAPGVQLESPSRATTNPASSQQSLVSRLRTFSFPVVGDQTSLPLSPELEVALKSLEDLWRDHLEDSEYARPVVHSTLVNAKDFLKIFSEQFKHLPEVSAFPNGEIGFEWDTLKGNLIILVDQHSIYFAYKTRRNSRVKGNSPWDSTIPSEVKDAIHFLYKE